MSANDHPIRRPVAVYGVHGDEGRVLEPVVREVLPDGFRASRVFEDGPYVSTVDPSFHRSEVGARWRRVIEELRPFDAYVEFHCYRPEAYRKLTSERREGGVPGLVDFGAGVLLGSVPRQHKRVLGDVLTLTLEVPREPSDRALRVISEILELIPGRTRGEFVEELRKRFPEATEEALRRFRSYYPDRDPF
ncbi:DUF2119 domain-containing protein [Methanopyrus sp.]